MKKIFSCVLSVAAASVFALPAIAGEVWSQPAGAAWTGLGAANVSDTGFINSDGSITRSADNFTLDVDTVLTSVKWWGLHFSGIIDPFIDVTGFRIDIHVDNGGFPGAIVYSESILNGSISTILDPSGGFNFWSYETDLSVPPSLLAGNYHLAITALDAGTHPAHWHWQSLKAPGTGDSDGTLSITDDNGLTWPRTIAFDLAFILKSNASSNNPPDCSGAAIAVQQADANCQATISGGDVTGITDPDGDPLTITVSPTTLLMGANTVTVTVDDGNGGTCSTDITVYVTDASPPDVLAVLTPVGDGDDHDDDDEGLFMVNFWTEDNCDPNPVIVALLWVQGLSDPIPVSNGQIIEFEFDDEEAEVEIEHGILEIEAPALILEVTATDASGNVTVAEAQPEGLNADNDEEHDDHDGHEDDDD